MAISTDDSRATDGPVFEQNTKAWLDELDAASAGSPPLYELSPEDAREVLRSVQKSVQVELAPAEIEDRVIAGGPTGEVSIRIIRPSNVAATRPMVFHTHGGGWILGGKDTHERLYRELANAAQAVVVFVDYIPAPDAQYPVQIEQAYTALEWALEHADEIGIDPARVALFGDSVGGNMAAALTLLAKKRRGPKLKAQVLFYPVTNADFDTDTYEEYADGPWLTRAAMRWFWDAYLPDEERRSEVTASPLLASLDQLRNLPPALVVNGQHDVLCAEGEAYARRLMEAGVPVAQVRYGGTIHDFVLLNPISETPAVRAAIAQAAGFLRKFLAS
jgi:acetyl esterase/lipase